MRLITNRFPFSIGDLIYVVFIISALVYLIQTIKNLIHPPEGNKRFEVVLSFALTTINFLLGAYAWFMLLWGINYYRIPTAQKMNLDGKLYGVEELSKLAINLADSVNYYQYRLTQNDTIQFRSGKETSTMFQTAEQNYTESNNYDFEQFSTKKSLFNKLISYSGISGYYNPFTGEAQVNTLLPQNFQPFTISHELAHQTGIGAEGEANFIGFLAAIKSNSDFSKYSAFLEAFVYVNSTIGAMDMELRKAMTEKLNKGARKDLKEYKKFIIDHQNAIEPYISWYYDLFLKTNNQPKGIKSYNDFVELLLAYYSPQLIINSPKT